MQCSVTYRTTAGSHGSCLAWAPFGFASSRSSGQPVAAVRVAVELCCGKGQPAIVAGAVQVVCERAVAVVGNLSTSSEYFGALREAGVLGRLVGASAHHACADSRAPPGERSVRPPVEPEPHV